MQDDGNLFKLGQGTLFQPDATERYIAWQGHAQERSSYRGKIEPGRQFPYLRLQRFGPHLFPSGSDDGERWTHLPMITGQLPETLQVGLVAEHNTSEGFQAAFSQFKLHRFHFGNNPRPWKGPPAPKGCVRCHAEPVPKMDPDFQFDWAPMEQRQEKK